jgi:hypothetical protein
MYPLLLITMENKLHQWHFEINTSFEYWRSATRSVETCQDLRFRSRIAKDPGLTGYTRNGTPKCNYNPTFRRNVLPSQ